MLSRKKIKGENMHISVVAYENVLDLTEKKNNCARKKKRVKEKRALQAINCVNDNKAFAL